MTRRLACHRDASLTAAKNTFASMDVGLNLGSDLIASGLRKSADGELCVRHDQTPDHTTNGNDLPQHHNATMTEAAKYRPAVIENARAARPRLMARGQSGGTKVFHRPADAGLDDINHDQRDVSPPVLAERQ